MTTETVKRRLPKDELRDDALEVFCNSDDAAESMCLTDPDVAIAAFKAVFFDDAAIQKADLKLAA